MNNDQPRWTEIEHLPEWDEEFYDVYTAKKFGKWVMLKTLKEELRDDPKYQAMIEKELLGLGMKITTLCSSSTCAITTVVTMTTKIIISPNRKT